MGVSVARVSQIEHGEVTSFEVIARYVEALGGRLDLVADFGDRTVGLPASDTTPSAAHNSQRPAGPSRKGDVADRQDLRADDHRRGQFRHGT
jgi:hypothetical protein